MIRALCLVLALASLASAQGSRRTPNLALKFGNQQYENDNLLRLDETMGGMMAGPYNPANSGKVYDRGGMVYNVQNAIFGAVGDGVADDTAAIQGAINAAVKVGGHQVYLPPGDYRVSDTDGDGICLTLDSEVALVGAGKFQTTITYAGTDPVSVIQAGPITSGTTPEAHISIRDLGIKFTSANHASMGIHLVDTAYCDVRDVRVASSGIVSDGKIVAIKQENQATSLIPSGGFCEYRNLLLTQPAGTEASGSVGLYLKGSTTQSVRSVAIGGWGNIEDFEVGIKLERTAHVVYDASMLLQGNATQIALVDADQNIFVRPQMAAATTENVNVDSNSTDNRFVEPSFFTITTFGTDAGVRTTLERADNSAANIPASVYPGRFRWGRHTNGATAATTAVHEFSKLNADAENIICIRNQAACTTNRAMVVQERGSDSTRDMHSWDINGVQMVRVSGDGQLLSVPPTAQTITAGATITANACGSMKRITSAGAVTTNTTNTFTAPATTNAGCVMDVCNSGSNNITLDQNALFTTAGGADLTLGADDCVRVACDGAKWRQVAAVLAGS